MATADTLLSQETSQPSFEPVIAHLGTLSAVAPALSIVNGNSTFDPVKHLAFQFPSKSYTMKDIGLPEDIGISSVAVTEPFPLFTPAAIQQMRAEILSDNVWDKCRYSSVLAACQLRGYCPRYANFVYDAWKDPATLSIISKVAGVDLVPNIDLEIGHINISVKSETQKDEELAVLEKEGGRSHQVDKPVVDWHTDSYPFVCVVMLSDASTMIGGETALRTGNGGILKVRGPQMGSAVVLQGRYIEHQALRALGTTERITMVTSFRPRSPHVRDDSVLTTVRPISVLSELYYQFSEYRLEMLEERIRATLRELRESKRGEKLPNIKSLKQFLNTQQEFLKRTSDEIIEEDMVVGAKTKEALERPMKDPGAPNAKRLRVE
ncbi:MAG: hypothetical protein M1833_001300 [Piccolia ochrophora]|nr:MAG: hypothetical protein M1833_001300 [Piccolia ochrophora]